MWSVLDLSHRPTSDRSVHLSLHWSDSGHTPPSSCQLHCPIETERGGCVHGNRHCVDLSEWNKQIHQCTFTPTLTFTFTPTLTFTFTLAHWLWDLTKKKWRSEWKAGWESEKQLKVECVNKYNCRCTRVSISALVINVDCILANQELDHVHVFTIRTGATEEDHRSAMGYQLQLVSSRILDFSFIFLTCETQSHWRCSLWTGFLFL